MNPFDTLSFTISTDNLNAVITELEARGGASFYPVAWEKLTKERARRQVRAPDAEIRMARNIFDALPEKVRELLPPVERCPQCSSEIYPAKWGPRQAWTGLTTPDHHPEFSPARCKSHDCDWEGPKDAVAVERAKKAAREQ